MAIDRETLLSLDIPDETRTIRSRDLILYALAVGLEPTDAERDFIHERALRAVPTVATVLGYHDGWLEEIGVPVVRTLHAAQGLVFHRPVPTSGTCIVRNRIAGALDKGAGKAALILQETTLAEAGATDPFATGLSTVFIKGGGGFGGSWGRLPPPPREIPDRAPDMVVPIGTRPEQPFLFRLLGDLNPLHVDPEAARAVGFDRPILHGACTYGIACVALLRAVCEMDPARLASIEARFVAPVLPGEALSMALWRDRTSVLFRLSAPERETVILDAGFADLRAG